jgi:hypothetical protein
MPVTSSEPASGIKREGEKRISKEAEGSMDGIYV